ncbi:hypothetical protein F5Y08DRAFT_297443 [Xylaria arbuscula]|nr:hypothetical protein F5Y08DRAFT_297443 [Xylaria arbuscula]
MSSPQTPPNSIHATPSSVTQGWSTQQRDSYICEICQDSPSNVKRLVDHLVSKHPNIAQKAGSYHCGRSTCPKVVKSLKDFERHLISKHIECQAPWRCHCGYATRRKDHFRNHLGQNRCQAIPPYRYMCACGNFEVDSRQNGAPAIFKTHFNPCGRGRRGRPRKG